MAWASPNYSRTRIDAAGNTIIDPFAQDAELAQAYAVINNWRASHSLPLNTFQIGLRKNAKKSDPQALIAQRIKRLSSIEAKLRRFKHMNLSQMQDIGGCRAIVGTVNQVYEIVERYKHCRFKHKLKNFKDYIKNPPKSGYRSFHLIYYYHDRKHPKHKRLQIEIQLRSRLQHAWATSVEIVDAFTKQALKSSHGRQEWLRFFALIGSLFARAEKTSPVPDAPIDRNQLMTELHALVKLLDVNKIFLGYANALDVDKMPGISKSDYFLLKLDPSLRTTTVWGFNKAQLDIATERYMKLEGEIRKVPGAQVVLVSGMALKTLRRAYPNYFMDATVFLNVMNKALGV